MAKFKEQLGRQKYRAEREKGSPVLNSKSWLFAKYIVKSTQNTKILYVALKYLE